jgi:hypothetical protein
MMLHLTDQLLFVRSKLDHQCAKRPFALEYKQTYSQASLIVRTGSEKQQNMYPNVEGFESVAIADVTLIKSGD